MLEPNELRAVIEHEKCHVQHRDPAAIFLLALISKSMRYIPIFPVDCTQISDDDRAPRG